MTDGTTDPADAIAAIEEGLVTLRQALTDSSHAGGALCDVCSKSVSNLVDLVTRLVQELACLAETVRQTGDFAADNARWARAAVAAVAPLLDQTQIAVLLEALPEFSDEIDQTPLG